MDECSILLCSHDFISVTRPVLDEDFCISHLIFRVQRTGGERCFFLFHPSPAVERRTAGGRSKRKNSSLHIYPFVCRCLSIHCDLVVQQRLVHINCLWWCDKINCIPSVDRVFYFFYCCLFLPSFAYVAFPCLLLLVDLSCSQSLRLLNLMPCLNPLEKDTRHHLLILPSPYRESLY